MQDSSQTQYLEAMGIDVYVARYALPGAAASPVRELVPEPRETEAAQAVAPPQAKPMAAPTEEIAAPELVSPAPAAAESPAPPVERPADTAVRFSLAAVYSGGIVWLEVLEQGALAREQVQLIASMARALRGEAGRPAVTQFDWPTHNNRQLDRGLDAARDALAAFLQRNLEQRSCRDLVLLGESCERFVERGRMPEVNRITTHSTAELLAAPALKRAVWQQLRALAARV